MSYSTAHFDNSSGSTQTEMFNGAENARASSVRVIIALTTWLFVPGIVQLLYGGNRGGGGVALRVHNTHSFHMGSMLNAERCD